MIISSPSPTTIQVSGRDAAGRTILSVLTKRTYQLTRRGRCVPSEREVPLVLDAEDEADAPGVYGHDPDIFPFKLATDVVVRGQAWAPRPCASFTAGISVPGATRMLHVVGDRRCTLTASGRIVFSTPAPLRSVPLRFDHAYGGADRVSEARLGNPAERLAPYMPAGFDPAAASPYRYPRNTCGRGYLIEATREAIEQVELPNLEDPTDPLTPERLAVGAVGRWPAMPMPQAFGFVDPGWFPRCAYFGVLPKHEAIGAPIPEVVRGLAPTDVLTPGAARSSSALRFANGAAPTLQVVDLPDDAVFVLHNLDPDLPHREIALPGERPRIWIDGREGRLLATEPALHTVVVDLEREEVTVVWRGAGPARRPYLDHELASMPLKVAW